MTAFVSKGKCIYTKAGKKTEHEEITKDMVDDIAYKKLLAKEFIYEAEKSEDMVAEEKAQAVAKKAKAAAEKSTKTDK